ncbi:hypothetical protein [uncultured Novosphingobium sp.]|uniref:hypothetical protein n=1 Tax=uncultured Novosphingobium sp. TaxID=292277 RepID=UPI00258D80C9|nr:hypothetical protein [uncultured Novosphingobium sp.]
MTNTVVTELNEIEQAIADFDQNFKAPIEADIKSFDAQITTLQDKSRDRTYDMVAALVDLADLLMVETPTEGYESLLVKRGITKPAKGHNPYMAFIKAVFSVKGVNGTWVFDNRSAEKHANHVRFLVNARRNSLITGTIQDYIRTYPEKLKGIEAQDREDNPNAAQADRVKRVRDAGRRAAAKATIDETFSAKDGDLLKVYGRVVSGKLELLHADVVSNDNERDTIFYKIGSVKL